MPSEILDRSAPPAAFIEEIKQILSHLNNYGYLQQHPLAAKLATTQSVEDQSAGVRLRREVVRAIESLSPSADVGFRSPHARTYNLLQLHYVEGFTVQEAARELGISERQSYRDIRRGEEDLAVILSPIFFGEGAPADAHEPGAAQLSEPQREIERLNTQVRPVNLYALLVQAQRSVENLAAHHGARIEVMVPPIVIEFLTVPELAQQLLISVLSHIVQADAKRLSIQLGRTENEVWIELRYSSAAPIEESAGFSQVTTQLARQLNWTVQKREREEGQKEVVLSLLGLGPTVLVIDDNEGLVELLKRYLRGYAYRVVGATSAEEGLQRVHEIQCDAIVLDIMMPQMDGWKVLQILRNEPRTRETPVIICSVINDPELAYSLGASLLLPKPVRRDEVLRALRNLGIST